MTTETRVRALMQERKPSSNVLSGTRAPMLVRPSKTVTLVTVRAVPYTSYIQPHGTDWYCNLATARRLLANKKVKHDSDPGIRLSLSWLFF